VGSTTSPRLDLVFNFEPFGSCERSAIFESNAQDARRVFGKVSIDCSRKPIHCTLQDHGADRSRHHKGRQFSFTSGRSGRSCAGWTRSIRGSGVSSSLAWTWYVSIGSAWRSGRPTVGAFRSRRH
jgi:hypothetical protein